MEKKVVNTMIVAVALAGTALAGPVTSSEVIAPASAASTGSFVNPLKALNNLYSNSDNPYIQSVGMFGRFQAQYASVNADDVNGNSVQDDYTTFRRVRVGAKVKAFNGLEFKANVNLAGDSRHSGGDLDWGYQSFDVATASYTLKNVVGFDKLKLSYGRHKINMGHESTTSSKKIKTVERSSISNKIYSNRYTGLLISGQRGDIGGTVGILSLDKSKFVGNWDAGNALYLSTNANLLGNDVKVDAFYNMDHGDAAEDQVGVGYEYAFSASTVKEIQGWDVVFDAIYGHNGTSAEAGGAGRGGSFWGLVVMPTKFIVDDKIEAVFRYAYQGSAKDNGIRANSRYFGQLAGNGRRGDQHHAIYAGLNYYFDSHKSKAMLGFEYDNLSTPVGDADGTTLWAAYRMYF